MTTNECAVSHQADNINEQAQTFTVLLVDDDRIVAEAIKLIIDKEKDIKFHYCNDPTLAVEMAEAIEPDVILLDMFMPNIDGLTLLCYFRANPKTKNIPVLALTVSEDTDLKAKIFLHGGNDYIIKLPGKIDMLARIRYHALSHLH